MAAIDTISASIGGDTFAADLAREAKATTLGHIGVLEQVAASAS